MTAMAEKLQLSFSSCLKYDIHPITKYAKEAAHYLQNSKHILILTGAGLSAASGIPTFRGDNGFWIKKYEGISNPEQILTMRFFKEKPHVNWSWHYDFLTLKKNCSPNIGH